MGAAHLQHMYDLQQSKTERSPEPAMGQLWGRQVAQGGGGLLLQIPGSALAATKL